MDEIGASLVSFAYDGLECSSYRSLIPEPLVFLSDGPKSSRPFNSITSRYVQVPQKPSIPHSRFHLPQSSVSSSLPFSISISLIVGGKAVVSILILSLSLPY
ncbi:hypothetical protein SDJN02_25010, partial [Cucurbita argyrosperma subsp. argyrosperma]